MVWPRARQRLLSGGVEVAGVVAADAGQAPQVAVPGRRGRRAPTGSPPTAGRPPSALLPADLREVAVEKHADDEARVGPGALQAGEGDQLGDAGHLHRPVTDYKDLEQTAQAVASTTSMLAANLARLLKQPQYPLVS